MLNVGAFIPHPSLKTSGHGLCLSMDNCHACINSGGRSLKVQSFGIPFCKGVLAWREKAEGRA